jgi:ATP-dependent Clp protease protease subunit
MEEEMNKTVDQLLRSGNELEGTGGVDARAWFMPMIIEKHGGIERVWDPISRLSKDRNIFITTPIDDMVAFAVVAQLMCLDAIAPGEDINLYIMSPGGVVTGGLAIHDTMKMINSDVRTIGMGHCESMGAFLLASGTKGKRFVMPSWRGMIHQPLGGAGGQATDVAIHNKEMQRLKKMLTDYLAEYCGKTSQQVHRACERDHFMSPQQAIDFGLVDHVLPTRAKKSAKA